MSELQERDAMKCRSCGNEERASEGYPCKDCGTFICLMCVFKGVDRCVPCAAVASAMSQITESSQGATPARKPLGFEWPDH